MSRDIGLWLELSAGPIAWFVSLMRVIRAVILAGGLAALGAYLMRNK